MSRGGRRAVSEGRGSVAVICPFHGTAEEGVLAVERLARIARAAGDELVVVDNTPGGVLHGRVGPTYGVRVIQAAYEQSSYHARNVGAESVETDWLLFVDADCIPAPTILDDYFAEPIPAQCGAVAGAIAGVAGQPGLLSRYARARGVLDQRRLAHGDRPFGATANLLVRRAAWSDVGGFREGIVSGGDVDFCWRLQDAGWTLVYREASVEHLHRESLGPLVRQFVRYGAGRAWLERSHPEVPRSSKHLALLLAAPALVAGHLLAGRTERAAFRAVDAAIAAGALVGRALENRPVRTDEPSARQVDAALITDAFPEHESLRALEQLGDGGRRVRVEAARRPARLPAASVRGVDVAYLEDDGVARRLWNVAWLVVRRPRAALRLVGLDSGRGAWQVASRARRLADGARPTVYYLRSDKQAFEEARRLGRALGLACEPVDG